MDEDAQADPSDAPASGPSAQPHTPVVPPPAARDGDLFPTDARHSARAGPFSIQEAQPRATDFQGIDTSWQRGHIGQAGNIPQTGRLGHIGPPGQAGVPWGPAEAAQAQASQRQASALWAGQERGSFPLARGTDASALWAATGSVARPEPRPEQVGQSVPQAQGLAGETWDSDPRDSRSTPVQQGGGSASAPALSLRSLYLAGPGVARVLGPQDAGAGPGLELSTEARELAIMQSRRRLQSQPYAPSLPHAQSQQALQAQQALQSQAVFRAQHALQAQQVLQAQQAQQGFLSQQVQQGRHPQPPSMASLHSQQQALHSQQLSTLIMAQADAARSQAGLAAGEGMTSPLSSPFTDAAPSGQLMPWQGQGLGQGLGQGNAGELTGPLHSSASLPSMSRHGLHGPSLPGQVSWPHAAAHTIASSSGAGGEGGAGASAGALRQMAFGPTASEPLPDLQAPQVLMGSSGALYQLPLLKEYSTQASMPPPPTGATTSSRGLAALTTNQGIDFDKEAHSLGGQGTMASRSTPSAGGAFAGSFQQAQAQALAARAQAGHFPGPLSGSSTDSLGRIQAHSTRLTPQGLQLGDVQQAAGLDGSLEFLGGFPRSFSQPQFPNLRSPSSSAQGADPKEGGGQFSRLNVRVRPRLAMAAGAQARPSPRSADSGAAARSPGPAYSAPEAPVSHLVSPWLADGPARALPSPGAEQPRAARQASAAAQSVSEQGVPGHRFLASAPPGLESATFRGSSGATLQSRSPGSAMVAPPLQFYRWTNEEDMILLEHVWRHGTRKWTKLKSDPRLQNRDNKACCNRFLLLKRKFLEGGGSIPESQSSSGSGAQGGATLVQGSAESSGGGPPPSDSSSPGVAGAAGAQAPDQNPGGAVKSEPREGSGGLQPEAMKRMRTGEGAAGVPKFPLASHLKLADERLLAEAMLQSAQALAPSGGSGRGRGGGTRGTGGGGGAGKGGLEGRKEPGGVPAGGIPEEGEGLESAEEKPSKQTPALLPPGSGASFAPPQEAQQQPAVLFQAPPEREAKAPPSPAAEQSPPRSTAGAGLPTMAEEEESIFGAISPALRAPVCGSSTLQSPLLGTSGAGGSGGVTQGSSDGGAHLPSLPQTVASNSSASDSMCQAQGGLSEGGEGEPGAASSHPGPAASLPVAPGDSTLFNQLLELYKEDSFPWDSDLS